MTLERENILSLEARKLFKKSAVSDDNYVEEFEQFQTDNWRVKVRQLQD